MNRSVAKQNYLFLTHVYNAQNALQNTIYETQVCYK